MPINLSGSAIKAKEMWKTTWKKTVASYHRKNYKGKLVECVRFFFEVASEITWNKLDYIINTFFSFSCFILAWSSFCLVHNRVCCVTLKGTKKKERESNPRVWHSESSVFLNEICVWFSLANWWIAFKQQIYHTRTHQPTRTV